MSDDLMRRLSAADPACGIDLPRPEATLREAIMRTDVDEGRAATGRRRRRRRVFLAGGVAVALLGGGGAFAAYENWYVSTGGADRVSTDGVLCTADWSTRGEEGGAVGGPFLTGDPVADCASYVELTGHPTIVDPVAFWSNYTVWVAPAAQVPDDAERQDDWSQEVAVRELDATLNDWVDGVRSTCTPVEEAVPTVEGVLAEFGFEDLRVRTQGGGSGECAEAYVDRQRGVVVVLGVEESLASGGWVRTGPVAEIRDGLSAGIAAQCLDLESAEAVARDVLGRQHHWPLAAIEDPSASCTRVDMEVGGSVLVTLRGPRSS